MPKTWYAVHTIAGHENRVRDVLTRRAQVEGLWGYDIFQILIPTEREFTTRAGKRVEVDRKVFPGYILIEMNMTDDAYKLVKSTSGVTGFVQSGNKPVPLEDYEVTRIMKNLEKSKEAPKIAWQKGDAIRVVDGPFADFSGRIEEVNSDRERLKVLINIFGRDTPVELEFTQVEKL
ncbi:MAG: transcription termination/antitermination factor NusG [Armatimonadetes bacterium]|uniref:Transcription termination/antitermination protein NusG n=1 Tax=Candidatus Nitrosymbiomonas proteolyticus TaxID=2608984 RepID=A0A809RAQ1_9BACT|nr:MAG: transcription termination/antitermination factor NusG [Armatimonadota bacterium]MBV6490501.1 Transcription termination/antitermination protein NusG [Fimbriimonadaceae bacterium]QOJ11860.1 MAG: transcription termination/antitermination factor NusG [Chthonomonadaceae bacterium]BBO23728.1 transcription termination/antitermination protein NusG [Candidatus Nitrosymbiomonas proteolyticus]MBL1152833.1 transcription termination/antitermination factor NusG [Armatimonadota bacterium]